MQDLALCPDDRVHPVGYHDIPLAEARDLQLQLLPGPPIIAFEDGDKVAATGIDADVVGICESRYPTMRSPNDLDARIRDRESLIDGIVGRSIVDDDDLARW